MPEPPLPEGITAGELDEEARRDLRGLQKDTAEVVARHLVAAGRLVDEDPELALEHARFARKRASRIAVVREAAGIAAYHAGEWNEALGELRAARRMGGGPGHLAVIADIERALGRPERALELARGPETKELDRVDMIELTIVVAGARRDLGELDAAVVGLQIPELDPARRDPWSARLFYAYADNLLAAGRESDALQWFAHTLDADVHQETDATARIAELTGEDLADDGIEFGEEDLELEADEADDEVDADEVDEVDEVDELDEVESDDEADTADEDDSDLVAEGDVDDEVDEAEDDSDLVDEAEADGSDEAEADDDEAEVDEAEVDGADDPDDDDLTEVSDVDEVSSANVADDDKADSDRVDEADADDRDEAEAEVDDAEVDEAVDLDGDDLTEVSDVDEVASADVADDDKADSDHVDEGAEVDATAADDSDADDSDADEPATVAAEADTPDGQKQ